jgi:hypothetical protein
VEEKEQVASLPGPASSSSSEDAQQWTGQQQQQLQAPKELSGQGVASCCDLGHENCAFSSPAWKARIVPAQLV